jgi:hypothetical protein
MLSSPHAFSESIQNEINFRDIKGLILEKVCKYLLHKVRYSNSSAGEVPEFKIDPTYALELLMAGDFLEVCTRFNNSKL